MKIKNIILMFIIVLIFNMFLIDLTLDDLWNFGFAYNISTGLIPYRDFNMVITPLYPMIMSFFLFIFSKQILVMYFFNSLIVVSIMLLIKKFCKNSYYLFFILLLPISTINYSLLSMFILLLIIYQETHNKNDFLIGLLLALSILTKQNVGVFLLIPSIIMYKQNNNMKRLFGFVIPLTLFFIYLIVTNSLTPFINYTLLGLFSFADSNTLISPLMILEIFIIIFLIYKLFKNKKDIFLLYTISFQIITYPIFDAYHFMLAFIIILIYILKDIKLDSKIIKTASIIMIILMITYSIIKIDFNKVSYQNNINNIEYRMLDKKIINETKAISKYIKDNNLKEIYLFNSWSYLIKLEADIKINKYDLINNGNLGYKGEEKILNDIKNSKNATFILIKNEILSYGQINKNILKYITNNMTKINQIGIFSIYKKIN